MVDRRSNPESGKTRRSPATTPEGQENRMISLAVDLAEKQLREGSASAQVITHYLKLAGPREKLERKKLEAENELLKARVDAIASGARIEELYGNAITAMRSYQGQEVQDEDEF